MQSLTLRGVLAELRSRRGARVEETASLGPLELRLRLGNEGWIVLSIHPRQGALYTATESGIAGHARPSPFAQLVWTTLGKSRFVETRQAGLDRVCALTFERRDRLGDARRDHLVAELTGAAGNLFLVEGPDPWGGRILDRLRPKGIGPSERPLSPGGAYRLPESGRVDATEAGEDALARALEAAWGEQGPTPRAMVEAWTGVSPLIALELARRAGDPPDPRRLARAWLALLDESRPAGLERETPGPGFRPVLFRDARGKIEVLPFIPTLDPDSGGTAIEYPSLSAALTEADRAAREEEPRRSSPALFRPLRQTLARVERGLAALEEEKKEAAHGEEYRRFAEALLASPKPPPRGTTEAKVLDPAGGEVLSMTLNPKLNAAANAELFFKRARKAERTRAAFDSRRRVLAERRRALEILAEELEKEDGVPTPDWLARAERQGVPIPREEASPEKRKAPLEDRLPSPLRPRRIELGDGWEALIGKSNRGNDVLTHEIARPDDVWMHAHQAAGSHVVLRHHEKGKEPPKPIVFAAAALAAHFSKARGSSKVSVLVSHKRHVHRPRKAPPGTVTVAQYETIMVAPQAPKTDKEHR